MSFLTVINHITIRPLGKNISSCQTAYNFWHFKESKFFGVVIQVTLFISTCTYDKNKLWLIELCRGNPAQGKSRAFF